MNGWGIALVSFFGAVLSALGMGGGGILLMYLTAYIGLPQPMAQGINLIFFLPIAAVALCIHTRNRLVCWRVVPLCVLTGLLGVWLGSRLALTMEPHRLGKCFGVFLLVIGIRELLAKPDAGGGAAEQRIFSRPWHKRYRIGSNYQWRCNDTMSKLRFSTGKFKAVASSKGFYAAMALCLAGAGAATWMAVDRTLGNIEESNQQFLAGESQWNQTEAFESVEKKQEGIEQETDTTDSYDGASASSGASESSGSFAASGIAADLPASSESQVLSYTLPVQGQVICGYSNGELVKSATLNDWRTHDGVDLSAEKGTEVAAAADGTVSEVRADPLWGTVVTIDHSDGNQTMYCGLESAVSVKAGDTVTAGQTIGVLEGVPCEISDASHLHFAVRQNEAWTDPLAVLQQGITED